MRAPITLAAALLFAFNAGSAQTAPKQSRSAKGKFGKSESGKAAVQCRDIKTKKFAKCGLPGTEPVH